MVAILGLRFLVCQLNLCVHASSRAHFEYNSRGRGQIDTRAAKYLSLASKKFELHCGIR
jgi:hypothetical protein